MRKLETVLVGKSLMSIPAASAYFTVLRSKSTMFKSRVLWLVSLRTLC